MREDIFQPTIEKTNLMLDELGEELKVLSGRRQVYSIMRAVLHALRDRLTVEEATDLGAQLPILIRGVYYEGFTPAKLPMKMDKEEFLERIRDEFPAWMNYKLEDLVKGVLKVLNNHITPGEIKDIKDVLPKKIEELFP